jgi:hypothetical protein
MSSLQTRSSIFLGIQSLFVSFLLIVIPDSYEGMIEGTEILSYFIFATGSIAIVYSIVLIVSVIIPYQSYRTDHLSWKTIWKGDEGKSSVFFLPGKKVLDENDYYRSIIEMDENELTKNLCLNLSFLEDKVSRKMLTMRRSIFLFIYSFSAFISQYAIYSYAEYTPTIIKNFVITVVMLFSLAILFIPPQYHNKFVRNSNKETAKND